ncbi:hypothetical protein FISHEDRAFT_61788 [Fistulina hepatica ATCC 64428]|uniref:BZIP domain-containing protein n=1 Tax=Fistulina hepatica ATCC 64428 TaxID=1128425 RepID=A0A0D7A295_9AGAR|nr:hypothetical protein FISHEDRAFT_61788 [Fistulina hepatica ATCC 64428]
MSSLYLPLSHVIAQDAPLLSPVSIEDQWPSMASPSPDFIHYGSVGSASSPPSSAPSIASNSPCPSTLLQMRLTPEVSESDACMSTHQLFDFPDTVKPYSASVPSPPVPVAQQSVPQQQQQHRVQLYIDPSAIPSLAEKRSGPLPQAQAKKSRIGERIHSKDFVPPDVSGLSKREARLVKNRAAAFLSRQRKREEFESMEIRVAELERENARLLALTQNLNACETGSKPQDDSQALAQEVAALRAQLAAAEERERNLAAELASKNASIAAANDSASPRASHSQIKVETQDAVIPPTSMSRLSGLTTPTKSASLGLMVLLCALPTLLSGVPANTAPNNALFSLPTPATASSSSFGMSSLFPSNFDRWSVHDNDLSLDFGLDPKSRPGVLSGLASGIRKLEFADTESVALAGLRGLDISFDTASSEDGKIRVRIHSPSSSAQSRATSPGAASSVSSSDSSSSFATDVLATPPLSTSDPFLGVGSPIDMDYGFSFAADGSQMLFDRTSCLSPDPCFSSPFGSELSFGESTATSVASQKRHVRISLRTPPIEGGEGGEWEVQFC